jgi:hypothetical protein
MKILRETLNLILHGKKDKILVSRNKRARILTSSMPIFDIEPSKIKSSITKFTQIKDTRSILRLEGKVNQIVDSNTA